MPVSEPSSFTFKITDAQVALLREKLTERNFTFREVPYAHFGAQKQKLSINAYQSGKLLVQGKGARDFVEFVLEPEVLGEAKLGYLEVHQPEMFEPHLGIDESGKGDFFGPLVIAGVYTNRDLAYKLLDLGVKDSKQITSDKKALDLADAIKDTIGPRWKIIPISPARYNELYKKIGNLNRLLAWGHATAIEELLAIVPDCPRALSDKFANEKLIINALKEKGRQIKLEQRTKAESDIAVAAASVLARAEFLRRLDFLGQQAGKKLGKGVSPAVKETGRQIFAAQGVEGLKKVAKEHFKTFAEVCGYPPQPEVSSRKEEPDFSG